MSGYFKPLRRKIGVVTLVVACVFAAGWVRGQTHEDDLDIPVRHSLYRVRSTTNKLWVCYMRIWADEIGHYPGEIFFTTGQNGKAEIILAQTNAPGRIEWQSKMINARSGLPALKKLQLDNLRRDPEMKIWNIFGIGRYSKVRSLVDNPTGGILKTDEVEVIREELVVYLLPYPLITVALTLLSAWLLLSRPRQTHSMPSSEF